ncbi:hypothetical protein WMY93_015933 [Mugilogobius chulae]|uniref:Uncharacterized protein n=1 Tax=Mugilogobius chulae TaxID=88201 RepID=A0AAW0P1T7_9GOBI
MFSFFRRKATLVEELRAKLRAAEELNQALQSEVDHHEEERVALEKANNTSLSIQQELHQKNTQLQAQLEVVEVEKEALKVAVRETTQTVMSSYSELNQKYNVVQETVKQQTERNQELQEEVCKLQRDSEEKSQKERELQQDLREQQTTMEFMEKIEY